MPVYLAATVNLPASSVVCRTSPASICAGHRPRWITFTWNSTLPLPLGKARPREPLGQANFHSRSKETRDGGYARPIVPELLALPDHFVLDREWIDCPSEVAL